MKNLDVDENVLFVIKSNKNFMQCSLLLHYRTQLLIYHYLNKH